jgi:hypothetical protein
MYQVHEYYADFEYKTKESFYISNLQTIYQYTIFVIYEHNIVVTDM